MPRLLAALFACLLMTSAVFAETKRPNFVIIFIDDMGYGDLGCYGGESAKTPHIDKLAATGTRFTSFYAQTVCGPSRGALMTGRYPHNNGALGFNPIRPGVPTLPETLRENGYLTGILGKT
ncbi:MAG: sulfatase-like hydrolase/transferase, partial [Pirellulales bacterium]|nr:sulfatase-like hydrolase/transferase [Pirellulales bacterium]